MNVKELKRKLVSMGVPDGWYSINGAPLADTYILQQVYYYWEVFYVDERGNQGKIYRFDEESEACLYLLEALKREMELNN